MGLNIDMAFMAIQEHIVILMGRDYTNAWRKPILAQACRPQSKFPISVCLEFTVCRITKFPKNFLDGKVKTENPISEIPTRTPLPGFYLLPKHKETGIEIGFALNDCTVDKRRSCQLEVEKRNDHIYLNSCLLLVFDDDKPVNHIQRTRKPEHEVWPIHFEMNSA